MNSDYTPATPQGLFYTAGCCDKHLKEFQPQTSDTLSTGLLLRPCNIYEIDWENYINGLEVLCNLAYEHTLLNFHRGLATQMLNGGANVVFVTLWHYPAAGVWHPYESLTYRPQEVMRHAA